jgi:hypothetical protein
MWGGSGISTLDFIAAAKTAVLVLLVAPNHDVLIACPLF